MRGKRLRQIYVTSTIDEAGSNAFYYRELPFYAKALFVFEHIPFSLSLKRIFSFNSFPQHNGTLRKNETDSIRDIFFSLSQDLRGSDLSDLRKSPADDDTGRLSCDQYILRGRFTVTERFRKELRLLQSMVRKTNAQVIFTWPSVTDKTGNECYKSEEAKENLAAFAREITEEVSAHGFKFLGNPYESSFDSSCFKDTYYHIRHHCAINRTTRLSEQIESEGLLTKREGYSPDSTFKTLSDYALNMELSFIKSFGTTSVDLPIEGVELSKHLYFRSGWGRQEEQGIWSEGKASTIIIPRPEKTFKFIRFNGLYFNGAEKTGVWINEDFAGNFILMDKTIMVDGNALSGNYITVTLKHTNPVSAAELGLNSDPRKIKYGLQSIELMTDNGI